MKQRWRLILSLLALVAISGIGGGLIGAKIVKTRKSARHPQWNEQVMKVLQERLQLKPEQQTKVQQTLDTGVDEMRLLRLDTVTKANAIVDRMLVEIDAVILPEQRATWEQLVKERSPVTLDTLKVEPKKRN